MKQEVRKQEKKKKILRLLPYVVTYEKFFQKNLFNNHLTE